MTDSELIRLIEHMRDTMNSVATGGQRIDHVNTEYKQQYIDVDIELKQRGIQNTNSFSDLWDWHGRWSNDDMPTYRSRRVFLAELFEPLLRQVRDRIAGVAPRLEEPTGWPKVDRTISTSRNGV